MAWTLPPPRAISSAAAGPCRGAGRRPPPRRTSRTKASVMARPMPAAPPVTIAFLPDSFMGFFPFARRVKSRGPEFDGISIARGEGKGDGGRGGGKGTKEWRPPSSLIPFIPFCPSPLSSKNSGNFLWRVQNGPDTGIFLRGVDMPADLDITLFEPYQWRMKHVGSQSQTWRKHRHRRRHPSGGVGHQRWPRQAWSCRPDGKSRSIGKRFSGSSSAVSCRLSAARLDVCPPAAAR